MKSQRSRKWHARVIVREYDAALRLLDKTDPDFAFERACCGERAIRERYSQEELRERYLRTIRSMTLSGAAGSISGLQNLTVIHAGSVVNS